MVLAILGEFRGDVREHDDEVIVAADLPFIEKKDGSLQLVRSRALEISCLRKGNSEEFRKGHYMRERVGGSLRRIVALPVEVTDENSSAGFRNGVLEVRQRKAHVLPKSRIPIE